MMAQAFESKMPKVQAFDFVVRGRTTQMRKCEMLANKKD
jgi:hypothetical protein